MRDTFTWHSSPDIPTANTELLWCPFNRRGQAVGTSSSVADGVTFVTGKKHSWAAEIFTRGFLRNILPQSLIHMNSPGKYDFLQWKKVSLRRLSKDRDLSTPLFPSHCFQSHIFTVVTPYGCYLCNSNERQQWAELFGAGLPGVGLGWVRDSLGSKGTSWNWTENGFFWGLFAQLSPSTNARVPYMVRKTTRISLPSFTPPIILHSLIMSFINFL